ncbi:MAG: LPS export ABC transporter periplasmic protein LptC [Alphaproteobacteria bacterium]|nr:LPS export ABC transporter periplasmic protein LptC [Alphaproteobacteria bacterium]
MTGESGAAPRLEGLAARAGQSERRFAEAERHRRRVSRLKIALPLLAAVSAAAIFISLALNQRPDEHVAGTGTPGIEMHAPVLKGTGDNGKPYEVVAAEAVQTREGHVELTEVAARVELEDGVMTLAARSGTLHPETGATAVSGGVVIELGDVYRFETERAGGNMKTGIFTGDAPVRVTGPMGTIEAAGFRIEKSVKQVTFTGGVTSVFDPAAAKAADPGSKDKTP